MRHSFRLKVVQEVFFSTRQRKAERAREISDGKEQAQDLGIRREDLMRAERGFSEFTAPLEVGPPFAIGPRCQSAQALERFPVVRSIRLQPDQRDVRLKADTTSLWKLL